MKKRNHLLIIITAGILLLLCGFLLHFLGHSSLMYEDSVTAGNPRIFQNKVSGTCFAAAYEWEGQTDAIDIVIPDTWDGGKVTTLGGYFGRGVPAPFSICLPETCWDGDSVYEGVPQEFESSEPYTVQDIVFTLHLGKNINSIKNVELDSYYPSSADDGSITFLHPVVFTECDPENQTFYSENGKLYARATHQLVTELG